MRLEGVVLGGVLRLDESGRPFLLLASVLSLATGLLTIEHQEKPHSGYRFVLLLLLATCGATGLAMAGDALLLFTFSTILG
ncbi:MAG: hypothetical protein GWN58_24400, partial [Anaerolineae bacterium]|nr:hypothetical protein [Anaerolineae bacterium]